jgi:hypothetical protein
MNLPERNSDGTLPAYAFPGGYPIIYVTTDGEILCTKCATEDLSEGDGMLSVAGCDVFYEGQPEFCADCNVQIDSAYGDPETRDNGDEV